MECVQCSQHIGQRRRHTCPFSIARDVVHRLVIRDVRMANGSPAATPATR